MIKSSFLEVPNGASIEEIKDVFEKEDKITDTQLRNLFNATKQVAYQVQSVDKQEDIDKQLRLVAMLVPRFRYLAARQSSGENFRSFIDERVNADLLRLLDAKDYKDVQLKFQNFTDHIEACVAFQKKSK